MNGWIYIAVSSVARGIIRVDYSSIDPEEHAKKILNASELPGRLTVRYSCWVKDYKSVEKKINKAFGEKAVQDSPKWFRYTVPEAISVLREIANPVFDISSVKGVPPLYLEQMSEEYRLTETEIENLLNERERWIEEKIELSNSLRAMVPTPTKWINCPHCNHKIEAPYGPRINFPCPEFSCHRMFNVVHINKLVAQKN
jgi:hypothetical protein